MRLPYLFVRPDSRWRIGWDMISLLLIFWTCVAVPVTERVRSWGLLLLEDKRRGYDHMYRKITHALFEGKSERDSV